MPDLKAHLERRLIASTDYAGADRRASEPSFTEAVEVVKTKIRPVVKVAIGAVAVMSALVGWGVITNPLDGRYEGKAQAQDAHAALRGDIDGLKKDRDEIKGDVKAVKSATDRIVTLQLKQERRVLREEIGKATGQVKILLQNQLDLLNEELGPE